MRVVALISGGKDSCYNMMQCVAAGHDIVALANLRPPGAADELDSFMYQTVGHQGIDLYAQAMDLPLYRRTIMGTSLRTGREYEQSDGDEVEDLYCLLSQVKEQEDVAGVSVGAILSDYQRVRVENVCVRLQLQPLAYLWRRPQESLLEEMIRSGLEAIIIKVAAFGLDPHKHLGKGLADVKPHLKKLSDKYGVHVCGEGGEYETFTLDCPLFKKRIVVDAMHTIMHSDDAFAPVGYLTFSQMHTEDKADNSCDKSWRCELCPCQSSINSAVLTHSEKDRHMQETPSNATPPDSHFSLDGYAACSARTAVGYEWIRTTAGTTEEQNVQNQTERALARLQDELCRRGRKLADIVLVHLYVRNMSDFNAVNSVYRSFFPFSPPARVCVEAALPGGHLIQVDCLLHSWLTEATEELIQYKHYMHVQSVSHWAPANIGPYSQAVQVDEAVFCSGQIALIPCSMQLAQGGPALQTSLAMGHVEKVLQAMNGSLKLRHVLQLHVYVTESSSIPVVQRLWERKPPQASAECVSDGDDDDEQRHMCPVMCVVPCLPRGAAVELHAVAVLDSPTDRSFWADTTPLQHATLRWQLATSSTHKSACLSLSLSVHQSHPACERDAGLLDHLTCAFQRALQRADGHAVPLCARIFYVGHSALAQQYTQGLAESIKTSLASRSPAVVLVPVICLPDSQILHLSCWLSQ